jgi:D-alanyl-D-alanine carboxypeptidase
MPERDTVTTTRLPAMLLRLAAATLLASLLIAPAGARLYGHIPYGEVAPATLVAAPPGVAVGQPCRLQPAVIGDLTQMIAAARAALPGSELRGISCYRTLMHQDRVFCEAGRAGSPCVDPASRAESVAPPGYSEHGTGYAIDFTARPESGCPDLDACFAATAIGRWLIANAPHYGFELSFPQGNAQGVTWEPWHWRWVGTSAAEPGARTARAVFARARSQFPAKPRVPAVVVRVTAQPPVPVTGANEAGAALPAAPQPHSP